MNIFKFLSNTYDILAFSELINNLWTRPEYEIEKIDSYDIRQKILNISYVDWKKLGFSKGTLHYMKQNAKSDKPFTLNSQVLERVNKWEVLVLSQK